MLQDRNVRTKNPLQSLQIYEILRYKLSKILGGPVCQKNNNIKRKIKDLSKWTDILCLLIRRLYLENITILLKFIYWFNKITIRPARIFVDLDKIL